MKVPNDRVCLGYGSHKGKCRRKAGTAWTDFWCLRCDRLRRAYVGNQLNAISKSFGVSHR